MRKRNLRATAVGLSVLTSIALLGGCGSKGALAPNNGSSEGSSTPTVTIGKAVDTIGFSVVDVALAKHFFQQQGVNVKEVLLGGSAQATAALQGGSIQFVTMSSSALVLGRSKGIPLVSVDSLDYGVPMQLVVSNNWLKQHNLPSGASLTQRVQILKGAVYGGVSNTDIGYMHLLAQQAGLPSGSYQEERLQSQSELATTLANGKIDAFMGSPPSSLQAVAQGNAQVLVNGRDIPEWGNSTYDLLITYSSYAQSHPDIVKKVASAIAEANNFMIQHPDETLAIEQKHFPKIDSDVLKQSLATVTFAKDGQQNQQQWDNAIQVMKGTGLVSGNIVVQEGTDWTNQYIDMSKLGN